MATQSQTAAADYRHPGDMAHHVQQLQQAGFDDGQVRALASFVSDMAREAMRPFIERVEQRFDDMQLRTDQRLDDMQLRADQRHAELNQRLGDMQRYVDQQFDGVNQRLGDMQRYADKRLDRVETRLDNLEQHTRRLGEGLAGLDAKVEDLWRREWIALTVMGLGFVGIVVAILLATGVIG